MEDISRRNFLVGAGQAVGAACLLPVVGFAPQELAKLKAPVGGWASGGIIDCNIWYRASFLSAGNPTIRQGFWPASFTPYDCTISYEADVHDIPESNFKRVIQPLKEVNVDLSLDYTKENKEIFEKIEASMFGNELYKLALNIGESGRQLIGDFIVCRLDISNVGPMR